MRSMRNYNPTSSFRILNATKAQTAREDDEVKVRCRKRARESAEQPPDARLASAVWSGVVRYGVVRCGVVWGGVVWCGAVWCGVVWFGVGVEQCGVVWHGAVWCVRARPHLTAARTWLLQPLSVIRGWPW